MFARAHKKYNVLSSITQSKVYGTVFQYEKILFEKLWTVIEKVKYNCVPCRELNNKTMHLNIFVVVSLIYGGPICTRRHIIPLCYSTTSIGSVEMF